MAEDMTILCRNYLKYMRAELGAEPVWAFPGRDPEKHIYIASVEYRFNGFWKKTPSSATRAVKLTVYDLRHTFVVDRINLWLEQGLDFNRMLPYLSKFLGHRSFNETFYIPKQQNGSENTKATYKSGMKAFRTYVNSVAGVATNKFKFEECTYDFLLDYRNHLHDVLHLSEKTANNRLATIKSYMNYASARDVSLQQYAFAVSQVPFIPSRRYSNQSLRIRVPLQHCSQFPPIRKRDFVMK